MDIPFCIWLYFESPLTSYSFAIRSSVSVQVLFSWSDFNSFAAFLHLLASCFGSFSVFSGCWFKYAVCFDSVWQLAGWYPFCSPSGPSDFRQFSRIWWGTWFRQCEFHLLFWLLHRFALGDLFFWYAYTLYLSLLILEATPIFLLVCLAYSLHSFQGLVFLMMGSHQNKHYGVLSLCQSLGVGFCNP